MLVSKIQNNPPESPFVSKNMTIVVIFSYLFIQAYW